MERKDLYIIILGLFIFFLYNYIQKKIDYLATRTDISKEIDRISSIHTSLMKNYMKNTNTSNKFITTKNLGNLPIYYINLSRSPDRKKYMEEQFSYYNITDYHRIDGVDGKYIKKWYDNDNIEQGEVILSNGSIISYSYDYMKSIKLVKNSEMGCALSHLKAIKTIYDSGQYMAYIMEDDVSLDIVPYWSEDINAIIEKVPNTWDIINLCPDRDCYKNKGIYTVWKENQCWGCVVYLINRNGMKKVLDGAHAFMKNNNTFHINFKDISFKDPLTNKEYLNHIVSDWLIYFLGNTYNYIEKPLFYTSIHQLKSTIDHGKVMTKYETDCIMYYLKDYEDFDKI